MRCNFEDEHSRHLGASDMAVVDSDVVFPIRQSLPSNYDKYLA